MIRQAFDWFRTPAGKPYTRTWLVIYNTTTFERIRVDANGKVIPTDPAALSYETKQSMPEDQDLSKL